MLKTFFMTKTYRKLCFYDKKQTRLKMAHVASCRFIYIKTVLPKIAPFLRVSSLCFYFADFLLVVRFFVAGFSSLSFIIFLFICYVCSVAAVQYFQIGLFRETFDYSLAFLFPFLMDNVDSFF